MYEQERREVEIRLRALAAQLYDSTIRDPLTNLLNRRFFVERLASEIAFARRHPSPVSILALDIDHFKNVNDELGHAAGDTVLVAIDAVLRESMRQEDIVARVGGEEFVALLRGTDEGGACTVAERLRCAVAAHEISCDGKRVAVTVSIGCATVRGAGANSEAVMERADARMYVAKRAGRNRVVDRDESVRAPAPAA